MGRDLDDVVVGIDSADNNYFSDVIGNKLDTVGGNSLVSLAKQIVLAVGGEAVQLRVEQSKSGQVEEGAYMSFGIGIFDVDTGAITSANIDISGIVVNLEKSTGGGAFSNAGITQPVFAKANGLVSVDYRFLAGEWENGDVYKLTVSGITATVGSDTAYIKTMIWSNMIVEQVNVEAKIDAIQTDLGDYSGQTNLQSLLAALGIPDVAAKPLYTCLVTDRLDNAVYGQDAILDVINAGKTVWYCDSSVGASGAGTSWDTAFATITEAVAAAAAGDLIRIKGEFDEGAAIDINKELTLLGENTSSNQYNTLIYSNGAYPLIFVEANNVKIFNVGFAQQAAQYTIMIGDDPGEGWYKCHIRGCKFDGWGTSTIGIGNGTNADAPDLHIEHCLFRSYATGCISTETTRARINNNIFIIPGSTYGITHIPTGGNRPDTGIYDNIFIAVDATNGNGIVVTNTPTAGYLSIDGNRFINFSSPAKSISKRLGYCGKNNLEPMVTTGSYSYLDAGATQDIVEVTNTTKVLVRGIFVDCNTLTQNGTLGFMIKVDGTNYREVAKAAFTVASDDSISLSINMIVDVDFKFTWLEGGDEGAARALPYKISYEPVE